MINDVKSCVKITLTDTKPSIFESKVGGLGYIPHNSNFPTDSNGQQFRLLAQIDCSEIQLDEFPEKGLLQFWLLGDELYGCDFDNPTNQDGFRVIYYPEVDTTVTEDEIRNKLIESDDEEFLLPVERECGMTFEKSENRYIDYDEIEYDDDKGWKEWNNLSGHKVGGYPYFTQFEPRKDEQKKKYDFLLFQLDSDSDKVLWGDLGIGNFFISSEKLKNCDFSDVFYNWDCG
ncbi:MAG: DUF1963 domain-containing protein [Ruminococcus sp.]|nr:DUF1963 domain-containing protein [Ruminococcus sp.]